MTAIVSAFRRAEQTVITLDRIKECNPAPEEILVHVDGDEQACQGAVRRRFSDVGVLVSKENIGPGGARNGLIKQARHEIVASFDDDSYPVDVNYFARIENLFAQYPSAAVLAANIFTRGEPACDTAGTPRWVANFGGSGCAYRRSSFLQTSGYIPLAIAYGMEEVDLALRMHAADMRILQAPDLRVFHDTDYGGHAAPELVAGTIANAALLVYLRYPPTCWVRGVCQVFNTAKYALRCGRRRGVLRGFLDIPRHIYRHGPHRAPVPASALRGYLHLRSHPVAANSSSRASLP